MKTLKYILILILVLGAFHSCLVDNETMYDLNSTGKNLAGFAQARTSLSFVSDGSEYNFTIQMKVIGPTGLAIKNPVTVTVAADPSSTAIEGTHFRLDEPTLTLNPDNNLLGLFPITILTEGIIAPLDTAPIVVLKVVSATGDANVINNGKPIEITLNYGCFSNLAGNYSAVVTRTNYDGVVTTYDSYIDNIYQIGVGTYHTSFSGHYIPTNGGGIGGTEGFRFTDVCNKLTVPQQDLNDYYSNQVVGTDFGSVDPVTGVIILKYSIEFAAGIRTYETVYTPVP